MGSFGTILLQNQRIGRPIISPRGGGLARPWPYLDQYHRRVEEERPKEEVARKNTGSLIDRYPSHRPPSAARSLQQRSTWGGLGEGWKENSRPREFQTYPRGVPQAFPKKCEGFFLYRLCQKAQNHISGWLEGEIFSAFCSHMDCVPPWKFLWVT